MNLQLLIKKLNLRKEVLKGENDMLLSFAAQQKKEKNLSGFRRTRLEMVATRSRWEEVKNITVLIEKHIAESEGREYDPLSWIDQL